MILLIIAFPATVCAEAYAEVYQIPQEVEIPDKAYGIFQCPATSTSSPLYEAASTETSVRQRVVDNEDSALIMPYGKGRAILDHAGSQIGKSFWNVSGMLVGDAAFLIREGKPTLAYECTAILLCRRMPYNYQFRDAAVYPDKDDLVCIGCANDDGSWVYLAYYKYLGKMP